MVIKMNFEKMCFLAFAFVFVIYFPMQNVYLPTQTIFVLCKSLCINGEFFK